MKVKFMYNSDERDLYAYFPETIYKSIFGTKYNCYSSDGQHSTCDKWYILESREEVNPERYGKLYNELKSIYGDIELI
jgi:hypothetical protein